MPMTQTVQRFSNAALNPLYPHLPVLELPVNLAPSAVYKAGSILLPAAASANDVQTITAPGSGTYVLTFTNPLTTLSGSTTALAFGANDAAVQAALQLVLNATGGGTVTVATLAATFSGDLANQPVPLMTASAGSVAHTTVGVRAGQYSFYNAAGSGTPTAILKYDGATDASGLITLGSASGGGEWGQATLTVPAYFVGIFDTSKLVGLDANAVTKLGRLLYGTTSAGALNVN